MRLLSEEEIAAHLDQTLSTQGGSDQGIWLFAYGSLLWKPACPTLESRPALVRGWHRSFCFRTARFRGTPERPGLMMALDRGGQCRGMVFRLPADEAEAVLHALFRRGSLVVKPPTNEPRWMDARTVEGPVRALGFAVNRGGRGSAGRLPPGEAADLVAGAAGHWGSCAEYLRETVAHLEELGIRDRNLWRLRALVAERVMRACAADHGGGPAAARTAPEPNG